MRLGFIAFFIFWIALGIFSFIFFTFNNNVALKRKVLPIITIGAGAIFALYITFIGAPIQVLAIFIPAIGLITFMNLKTIKFCDSCGKTINNKSWFSKIKYCPRCGEELKE